MATPLKSLPNATAVSRAPSPILVLVAEDHADTRELFRMILENEGYCVLEATDGEETVHLAESEQPDLILMDGALPGLDGFDATRRIRRSANLCHVPIVFISGHAEPKFLALAHEAGCDEYLVKPVDFETLGGVLQKHLGRKLKRMDGFDYKEY
jgi:two-component system, cell cycle response regulator DivK